MLNYTASAEAWTQTSNVHAFRFGTGSSTGQVDMKWCQKNDNIVQEYTS